MAHIIADRVAETTSTTGTGTYTLNGAIAGFQSFGSAIGNANTCFYCVTDGSSWEVGRGTVTVSGGTTLARTEILDSSNGGSAVSWSAGSKNVFVCAPADRGWPAIYDATGALGLLLSASGALLGVVASFPASPDGILHLVQGSAGSVAPASGADELVVEGSATSGISILVPDANSGMIIVGSPSDNDFAVLRGRYNSGSPYFSIENAVSAAERFRFELDATPALGIGGTPGGTTSLLLPAGTTAASSARLPHGSAPSSPVNGDMWTTTAGLFVRINGSTVGPLT